MNSGLLTVVIPTRDRPDLLELCLRSIFECQRSIPNVIVSDNSTSNHQAIDALRRKYGFAYVRQSGGMSMTNHHNGCLGLSSTRWIMLLHDDDELVPDSLAKVESFLAGCEDVGIVVGGLEYIDPQGKVDREWIPETNGTFTAEDGLLRLALAWHARSPNTIFDVTRGRNIGGFLDIDGAAGDYTFFCRLAYSYGVAFLSERVGRYRSGHEQATNLSTPVNAEKFIRISARMGSELIRSIGCSEMTADRLIDDRVWAYFVWVAPYWLDSDPAFLFMLCQECLRLSPKRATWQAIARREYPLLFWRPQWLARFVFRVVQELRYLLKRQEGWQSV
jgi:glycosyltransferase involved in cell wall biosynthesis